MATQQIASCAQVKILWAQGVRSWMNVLGLRATGAMPTINQAFTDAMFTDAKNQFSANALNARLATTVSMAGLRLRSLDQPNLPEFIAAGAAAPGTGVGDALPLNAACCITLRTAFAGKSFRGRTYFSGFTEAENDVNGRISTAASQACVDFLNGFGALQGAKGLTLAVLSFERDGVTIPEKVIEPKAGFGNPVTAILSRNSKWESQRRRTGRT